MTGFTGLAWRKVVDCAVSNSVHRSRKNKTELPAAEQDALNQYIQRVGQMSGEEANAVMNESVSRASEQVIADGKAPLWAKLGIVIGILGVGFNLFNLIFMGFSLIFLLFLFAAFLIITPCANCISQQKKISEAADLWDRACKIDTPEQLDAALQAMEATLRK